MCLLLAVSAQARTIMVDDDAPADYTNIQAAIDDANHGDTIIVKPGTYTGPGNRDIDFLGKAITVRSESGPDDCIIDCDHSACGFYFHRGEGANSVVNGFTITNGRYDGDGGGIYCYLSSPVITNCIIAGCTADRGNGGAISCFHSSPLISNCLITGNTALRGAAIYAIFGHPQIINCTLSANTAEAYGGAIYIDSGGCMTIDNCLITANVAPYRGAGVYGIGIYELTLKNTFLTGNRSAGTGGALYCRGGDVLLTNCTLSGNVAAQIGGGLHAVRDANSVISNSILWPNHAPIGHELALLSYDGMFPTVSVSYSDLAGGAAEAHVEPGCTLNLGAGNMDIDPCFASPGYWAYPSNPNLPAAPNDPATVWVEGDYHVKSQAGRWDATQKRWTKDDVTSLCIDAGDPNSDWTGELWPHGTRINLGAYGGTAQAGMSLSSAGNFADFNFDDFVAEADLMFIAQKWLCDDRLLFQNLDRDGLVNLFDLALFAGKWQPPPRPAPPTNPYPADAATDVNVIADLSWTSSPHAASHNIYFGTTNPPPFAQNRIDATFDPGVMLGAATYYWRIEELCPSRATAGPVWSFTTEPLFAPGPATNPGPSDGATAVSVTANLSWTADPYAASHDVYFGKTDPPSFVRNQIDTTFDPGTMAYTTTYFWRIDEVNPAGTANGAVWNFRTGSKSRMCFPADTLVWIAGKLVQISKVTAGQELPTFEAASAQLPQPQVESIDEHEGIFAECHEIVLGSGNRITVIDSHFFLLTASGQWARVQNLRPGCKLQSLTGPITIANITRRGTPYLGRVYNLKIRNSDRYFIGQDGLIARDY